jgi:hypothetical protein
LVVGQGDARICDAIEGRLVLWFVYDDQERVVEPHGHGWTRAGVEVLSGFQRDGGSVGGEMPAWKMFHLEKVRDLHVAETFAGPRPDYDPALLRIAQRCCDLPRRGGDQEMGS